MRDLIPIDLLLEQRRQHWLMHCRFVLERLLMPLCREGHVKTMEPCQRAVVLIDNRIDEQWLFTVLNTWLMCPKDSEFVLIADANSVTQAEDLLQGYAPGLKASVLEVSQLMPGVQMAEPTSLNTMLKLPEFWRHMPHELMLIIQTDALLSRPLDPFFFQFPYLGAPFIPRQHSEYFEKRRGDGRISGFFKTDTPIHGSPNPDVYPHLHGNGGLSIRQRNVMLTICERWGSSSPTEELEDVFFSRHVARVASVPPLEIAQAFSTETTYNPRAIGSHASWKFLSSADLADHLAQHLRAAWAMAEAQLQLS